MNVFFLSILSLMTVMSCKNTEVMELTKKEKAVAFIKSFETGDSKILKHIKDDFKSHNYLFPTGIATLEAYFVDKPLGSQVETIRVFEDGNYVIMHNSYTNVEGYPCPIITFDVVRFENDKIAEHWDNIGLEVASSINGHTQIGGILEVSEHEKTESNKTLVRNYMQTVFVEKQIDKLSDFLNGENFIQHNPEIKNGVSGITEMLEKLKQEDTSVELNKIHYVFGEGDFVLTITEGIIGDKPTAFYNLFRVENNKIAEHWDTIEEIQAKENWTNENGKF